MADSRFRSASINLSDDFDRDEDYNTMPDRYEKKARERLGEIADSIGDPRAKAMFLEGQEAVVQAGIVRIKDKAFGIEKDFMRAGVDEQLLAEENNVITGDAEAVDRAMLIIDGGAGADYLTAEEAQSAKATFKTNSAVKWLESIDPTKRLAALKEPLADNLPPDVRAKMTREAEVAQRSSVAQAEVDTLLADPEMDRTKGMAAIAKITDTSMRDETQRRFDYGLSAQNAAKSEAGLKAYESITSGFYTFNGTSLDERSGYLDQIRISDQWTNMNAAQRSNVEKLILSSEPPSRSSTSTLVELNLLSQNPSNPQALLTYFSEHESELSESDRARWQKIAAEPDKLEYKSLRTAVSALNNKLDRSNINNDVDRSVYTEAFHDWHEQYYESNQKMPDEAAIERKMDNLLIETRNVPGSFYGTNTKRIYKLSPSEVTGTIAQMKKDRPEIFKSVSAGFTGSTNAEFIQAYEAAVDKAAGK
jgi:hypothetical protein